MVCDGVFLSPSCRLDEEGEKERYDKHVNDISDAGYCSFLDKALIPLIDHHDWKGKHGLDYGSGPLPNVQRIMKDRGYEMNIYDPFYAPDRSVLINGTFDYITCIGKV